MKLTPLGSRVVVKLEEAEDKIGLIHLPDEAKKIQQFGVVESVGTKCVHLKRGNRVLLPKYHGTEVRLDVGTYTLILEDDVLVVVG